MKLESSVITVAPSQGSLRLLWGLAVPCDDWKSHGMIR
jgi:hypothetical protein